MTSMLNLGLSLKQSNNIRSLSGFASRDSQAGNPCVIESLQARQKDGLYIEREKGDGLISFRTMKVE